MTDEKVPSRDDDDWGDIPEKATAAGLAFYRQHVDDLKLATGESRVVDQLEQFTRSTARALFKDREPEQVLPGIFDEVRRLRDAKDGNLRRMRRVLATRYVDNFLTYVADLMTVLFRRRPEALSGRDQVTMEDVLRHSSIEEFVTWASDERVNRLSYKGFDEIADYFSRHFGIELIEDVGLRNDLTRGIGIRNLIIHRRGVVDHRFIRALEASGFDTRSYLAGEQLPNLHTFETLPAVTLSVRSLETRVVAKFDLPVHPVDAEVWWRTP